MNLNERFNPLPVNGVVPDREHFVHGSNGEMVLTREGLGGPPLVSFTPLNISQLPQSDSQEIKTGHS
jgi:hypothetical protein